MFKALHDKRFILFGLIAVTALLLFAGCALFEPEKDAGSKAVINEACSDNFSVIADETDEYCDYVELYNPSDKETDYVMYLSDNRDDLKKYKVEGTIAPKGYLLVWLSGSGKEGYLHAGFKLAKEGEQLFLTDESGNLLDVADVPALSYDVTYSRKTDGGSDFIMATGTPGESNEDATEIPEEYTPAPSFSLEDGFYEVGTKLSLSADVFDRIYYTLDGSEPDENSSLYTGPIELVDASERDNYYSEQMIYPTYVPPDYKVDKANVVKAISVNPFTGKKSRVVTHTYFCGFDKKPEYDGVEIISLTFDPDDLFDYDRGIFAMGKRYDDYKEMGGFTDLPEDQVPSSFVDEDGDEHYRSDYTNAYYTGRESEREAVMSVFDGEKNLSFTQNIGVRIAGESSRYNFQKSLNLYARDIYEGDGTFLQKFFDDNEKKVRLRRGDTRIIYQEPMLHSILSELGLLYQQSQMKAVFINGEYWGTYNLRELYDERYFLNHLGLEENEIWLIKNDVPDFGGDEAYESYNYLMDSITYFDASDDEIYSDICSRVDIDNLIDYFCALIYFDNEDIEPRHNQALWRVSGEAAEEGSEDLWRWMVYDLDVTCEDPENNTFEYLREGGEGLYLPGYLYANEDFKNEFRDRMLELTDTVFSYDNLHRYLTEWDALYRQQNIATVNRFEGGGYTEEDYEEDLHDLDEFFRLRPEYIKQYLEEDLER